MGTKGGGIAAICPGLSKETFICPCQPFGGGGGGRAKPFLDPGGIGRLGLGFGPPEAGRNRRPPCLAGETRRPWETRRQEPRGQALERGPISPARPRRPFPGGSCSSQPNGGAAGARSAHKGGSQRLPPLVWPAAGRPYAAPPYAPSLTIRGMRQAPIQNATAGKRQMLARLTIRTSQCAGIPVLFFVWLSFYV